MELELEVLRTQLELEWNWIGYTSYRVDILRIVERTTYGGHTTYGGRTTYAGFRSKRCSARHVVPVTTISGRGRIS